MRHVKEFWQSYELYFTLFKKLFLKNEKVQWHTKMPETHFEQNVN